MSISGKNKFKEQTAIRSVLYGILIAIFMLLLGSGIVAMLIYDGKIKETSTSIFATVMVFLSVLGGGSIAANLRKEKIAVISGITTAGVVLLLLSVNIMFFDAELGGAIAKILAALLGWIAASFIGVGKKKKR